MLIMIKDSMNKFDGLCSGPVLLVVHETYEVNDVSVHVHTQKYSWVWWRVQCSIDRCVSWLSVYIFQISLLFSDVDSIAPSNTAQEDGTSIPCTCATSRVHILNRNTLSLAFIIMTRGTRHLGQMCVYVCFVLRFRVSGGCMYFHFG